jgi:glyoxylase-like metal-dependent hydrolase (beta-lactamase superfamily II)
VTSDLTPLASVADGERLPAGVTRVRAANASPLTLSGTNTYLVGSPAWVIDPGPDDPDHVERVLRAAEAHGGIAGLALTHSHRDHAAAAPRLRELAHVELAAGVAARGDGRFDEPSVDGLPIDRVVADGDTIGPLHAIATPGHAADHVSFLRDGVLFCGDTVLGEGSVFIPPGGGSMKNYLESLRRLQTLELTALCPGHGPVVWNARAKLDEYIEHRLDRERRLTEALAGGLRKRDDLLDEVWDDAPAVLRLAAALTLEAHLDKLELEGRLPDGVERLSGDGG